ncbi:DUF6056 family protein [Francisella orientalis]|nr:DUF6056 family protein [Francisella orientalis]AFJ43342.1 hypothetical protein OOM_0868 [Francisella orientalis str. Toba 04]AHB98737.1 hypothetical protein M973_07950 [Francisella orientalis LADL 07-285A]OAM12808.1 hypothetical protein APD56_07550 [Francisella orientalis]
MNKSLKQQIFISFIIFLYFLFINCCQPLAMDDFWRALNDTLVNGSFFHFLIQDYTGWTGRMSAQALVYALFSKKYLTLSLLTINIINSISMSLFAIFIFKIVTRNKYSLASKDFIIYSFFFALMFTWTGFIGQVIWKTAAIQYLWGYVILTTLYYYLIIQNKKFCLMSLIVGLFIGLYNEQFVGVLLVFCLAYFIERKINNKIINKGILFFLTGLWIGGVILIAAPGNYVRLDQMSSDQNISIFSQLLYFIHIFRYNLWPHTMIIVWLFILYFILAITNKKNSKISVLIYSLTLIISIFIMAPLATSYGLQIRLMLIYYIIFFIAVMQPFYNNQSTVVTTIYKAFKKIYIVFLIGLLIIMGIMGDSYYSLYKFNQHRQEIIAESHSRKIENITIPIFELHGETEPYGITFEAITCDSSNVNNKAFAAFYGFKTVKAEDC